MSLLDSIFDPADVKALASEDLEQLCRELREQICAVTAQNGGHLASSLGAVELIVALLRQFDPLEDRIVFDVGHQTYAWKLLTGRKDQFLTLRKEEGLSGFPKRSESLCDPFDTGHSSTALSAALGYAVANRLQGRKIHSVAVVGDGAMINGQSFEALNHAGELQLPLLCLLNDNGISISPRVGGMARHLAALSASSMYRGAKQQMKRLLRAFPDGDSMIQNVGAFKNRLKGMITPPTLFDELGWSYWGPFDGHQLPLLEEVLSMAKSYEKPLVIHLVTQKGRGHRDAEQYPVKFHGVSPRAKKKSLTPSWSQAVASQVLDWARKEPTLLALTPAMGEGSCLGAFKEAFPDRFFDGGIAEEHMMTFSGALAAAGMTPVLFIYSTFLQRAMDQLAHDVALQNLPLTVAVDRAGFVGEDGETHQGFYDVAWAHVLPNVKIWSPADAKSLNQLPILRKSWAGPLLFRFPRGEAPEDLLGKNRQTDLSLIEGPADASKGLLALGSELELALQVQKKCLEEGTPPPSLACLESLWPLPEEKILSFCRPLSQLVILENGLKRGGIGTEIARLCQAKGLNLKVQILGAGDEPVFHAPQSRQRARCGLSLEGVLAAYASS